MTLKPLIVFSCFWSRQLKLDGGCHLLDWRQQMSAGSGQGIHKQKDVQSATILHAQTLQCFTVLDRNILVRKLLFLLHCLECPPALQLYVLKSSSSPPVVHCMNFLKCHLTHVSFWSMICLMFITLSFYKDVNLRKMLVRSILIRSVKSVLGWSTRPVIPSWILPGGTCLDL